MRDRPIRRLLGWLHLWVGLILCLPLAVLGITGSILVFEHELAEWADPSLHHAGPGAPQPVGAIVAAARAMAPPEHRASFVLLPDEPGHAARVRFAPPARGQGPQNFGEQSIVFVDPVTLAPLGARGANDGVLRQVFLLHANLMTRDRTGREIVGWLGVAMLTLGASGLVLWWPRGTRWRGAFGVRRGATGLRLHRDLHGAVGIWIWLVFITVSFSGVYLAFPQALGGWVSALTAARDLRAAGNAVKATPVRGTPPIDIDAAVAAARAALPEGQLRRVFLPQRPDQLYRVGFARPGEAAGAPLAQVFVDPWSRQVLQTLDPRGYTAGETFIAWQHGLHAGEGLGLVWKLLVFVSGLVPALFMVTGFSMWWLKRRARRAAAVARQAPAE